MDVNGKPHYCNSSIFYLFYLILIYLTFAINVQIKNIFDY